ncbi:MAG: ABC transporter substrate-binding protein, partial [Planctomycetota bacterium]
VVPPPRMVEAMRDGRLAGFCVGEPWNSLAVREGLGEVAITKYELWNNSPEKVLGVTAEWAERYPTTHRVLIEALIAACRWLDEPGNRAEACALLSLPQYVGVEASLLERSMTGRLVKSPGGEPAGASADLPGDLPGAADFHVFHRYQANFPWRSHAAWLLTQMRRWGQVDESADIADVAGRVFRTDVYRSAAGAVGLPCPDRDEKSEGEHASAWTLTAAEGDLAMGPDRWFDGHRFDPARPDDYLNGFAIRRDPASLREARGTDR